jgi:hypothetical protein
MKHVLTLSLLLTISIGFSQNYKFKNVDKYGKWIMGYQENPEANKLFPAFEFGVNNKKIAENGSRSLVISFFGSIFRADNNVINEFYEKVKISSSPNLHYGFVGSLWMANTEYSKVIMDTYLQLESSKKFKSDGEEKKPPFNIYNDLITDAHHLDIIWADFFATGNPEDIKRIISVLNKNNEISGASKWSLTSNGIQYKKIRQIILSESTSNSNDLIKKKLISIVNDINSEIKK